MEMKPAMVAIAAFVVITVIAAVLMPVLDDATATTDTFTNEGTRMSPVGDSTITITFSSENWNVNGVDLGIGAFPITQGTIMIYGVEHSSRCGYLYINENDTYSRGNIQRNGTHTYVYDGSTKTVSITSVVGDTTYTGEYTYIGETYYNDPNGDYIWSAETPTTAYIPDDWNNFNAWSIGSDHFYAIIGETILVDGTVMTSGVTTTLTTSEVTGYTGIKSIDSYTLDIDGQDPIECRGYILSREVTGERIVHLSDSESAILLVIPALLIVAIIIGILAYAIRLRE